MEFKILFLLVVTIVCLVQNVTASTEALLECGRVHQIDNIANLSSATASYSNSQCMLVCVVGSAILPVDSIHEGRSCPEDTNGICRNGQCIGGQEDALRECGLKHHLDFHQVDNHQGTAFTNDQCTLECVLGGVELPVNHLHEGSPCPANLNGVCRSGTCVTQSTNQGSTVTLKSTTPKPTTPKPTTPKPTTPKPITPPPTTVTTQPSIDTFSPSKMKLLNISIESTDPSLNPHQYIYLYFYEAPQSAYSILDFYGDPTKPNVYYFQQISNIPSKLNSHSRLRIDLYESGNWLNGQYVDLYTLFGTFYKNHKLTFGEQENFVHKIALYPHEKLMDVAVRFTIVFSKD